MSEGGIYEQCEKCGIWYWTWGKSNPTDEPEHDCEKGEEEAATGRGSDK